jgi:hypothetical protein
MTNRRARESCVSTTASVGWPAGLVATDALAAETVRLYALNELPSDTRRRLQGSGVLDQTYATPSRTSSVSWRQSRSRSALDNM